MSRNNNKSQYSRDDRKHIVQTIENLKNEEDYVAIFEILTDDAANSYTENSNGVFLNFSTVSDDTLDKISKYLKKINKKKSNQIEVDVDVVPNGGIHKNDRTHKLSNYEQNILRQRGIKKVLNGDNEYEQMQFTAKPKKSIVAKTAKKTTKPIKKTTKREIDC